MSDRTEISPARAGQAEALAKIHQQEISEGFLSTLGKPFLTLLYAELISAPDAACFVIKVENEVVAFACSCEKTSDFYRRFLRDRFFPAAVALLPRALRPTTLRGILETLRQVGSPGAQDLPNAELLSIAVEPAFQGKGFGQELVRAIAADFMRRGIQEMRVTAGAGLGPANTLYRKLGFALRSEVEIHIGTKSNIYVANTEQLKLGGSGHAG